MFKFVHPSGGQTTVARVLLAKMQLFDKRPDLAAKGTYTIASNVDHEIVELFFARVMGDDAKVVTTENAEQLRALCDELEFAGFDEEIGAVVGGDVMVKEIRGQILERLDEHDLRAVEHDSKMEMFWEALGRLDEQLKEVMARLDLFPAFEKRLDDVLRALQNEATERAGAVEQIRNDVAGAIAEAKREVGALGEDVQRLRNEVSEKASTVDVTALSEELAQVREAAGKLPTTPRRVQVARKDPGQAGTEFVYDQTKPFDGIIAHLRRECDGNVDWRNVVRFTASSGRGYGNAVDWRRVGVTRSDGEHSLCVCYDFVNLRVSPTSYSIRTKEEFILQSWALEVSNGGNWWEVIDRRENNVQVTGNFPVSAPPSGAFRYVRLRQTGKNDERCRVQLSEFELFGTGTGMQRPVVAPGEFPFWYTQPLDGIIAHLTRECGGNVHNKGVVKVTSSGGSSCGCGDAVDLGSYRSFLSKNSPNSWICYDFRERRVTPTSYSIRSQRGGSGCCHPKSWVLEVSNDGSEGSWAVVDSRENNNDLNDSEMALNFAISAPPSGAFRFVRLRQTGKNHDREEPQRKRSTWYLLARALRSAHWRHASPRGCSRRVSVLGHAAYGRDHCALDARVRRKRSQEGCCQGHSER